MHFNPSIIIINLLILSISSVNGQSPKNKRELLQVDKLRKDLIDFVENQWDYIKDHSPIDLLRKFKYFKDTKFKKFDDSFSDIDHLEMLNSVDRWHQIQEKFKHISTVYTTFDRFQNTETGQNRTPSPKQTWISLTNAILPKVPKLLNEVHTTIAEIKLLEKIKNIDHKLICSGNQSINQLMYNLYTAIALVEMKGYTLIQFSYMLVTLHDKSNDTSESKTERDQFIKRALATGKRMSEIMRNVSKELWRCDPISHKKDETYLEITQLLQGYIQNEVNLNRDSSCAQSCDSYQSTYEYIKDKNLDCQKSLNCKPELRCNGRIHNCKFVESDMWVCPGNGAKNRKYEYVEYKKGSLYGRKDSCSKERTKLESWWYWAVVIPVWHCSYCMCLCDKEGPYSDRYFSMRASLANIRQNRIITGLKFTKVNNLIHIQIQEGQLLPGGLVNKSTLHWVPAENFSRDDRFISKDQDYFTLSYENRAIDLDALQAAEGNVLTGVRFRKLGPHLNLEIYETPFNYVTGKLKPKLSRWKGNYNTEYSKSKRQLVKVEDADIPTRSKKSSLVKSTHNQFMKFTHTSFELDAAQTTIPFLDSQPVTTNGYPNSGAGLYYKSSNSKNGGYIGIKLITYDYSNRLLKEGDL